MQATRMIHLLVLVLSGFSNACARPSDRVIHTHEPPTRVVARSSAGDAGRPERTPVAAALASGYDWSATSPRCPGKITFTGTDPKNQKTGWFNEAQGLAGGLWRGHPYVFFATRRKLYGWNAERNGVFGVSRRLPAVRWEASIPPELAQDYNHFGDLDYQANATGAGDDLLYVPLEARARRRTKRLPLLLAYELPPKSQPVLAGVAPLQANSARYHYSAPWLAAWPPNPDFVFTSGSGEDRPAAPVEVLMYRDHDPGTGVKLSYEGSIPLLDETGTRLRLVRIGGGEFNAAGELFLLAHGGPCGPGLYSFALARHGPFVVFRRTGQSKVKIHLYRGLNEEFEGLTTGPLPVRAGDADIHAVLANWEVWGKTGIYIKHWRIPHSPRFPDP